MSYLVLARKYRPKTFTEVIGQAHITDILTKAIDQDKVAHAYLFCGPRGVGKTSCARLLAKELNKESQDTSNNSALFEDLENKSNFDIIEIDGASNRGIDEIRTLRENVKFAPLSGAYKIYIVDEVHMLTGEAFNALLKTLEEPPSHVKFIFATTEINKVPETIISRCQRFDFKRISINTIMDNLKSICATENLSIDDEAIYAIAKSAKGSMRDGLSIMDQISALGDKQITSTDVYSMLGIVEVQFLFDLVDQIGDKNTANVLKTFNEIIEQGKDIKQLGKDLIEHFRHLMVIKIGGKSLGKLVNQPIAIKEMYLAQTTKFSVPQILLCIEELIKAQETARIMETQRIALEIAFAKISFDPNKPTQTSAAPKLANNRGHIDFSLEKKEEDSSIEEIKEDTPEPSLEPKEDFPDYELDDESSVVEESTPQETPPEPVKETPEPELPKQEPIVNIQSDGNISDFQQNWNQILHVISQTKVSVSAYLQESFPTAIKDNKVTVTFPEDAAFQKECVDDQQSRQVIEQAIKETLNIEVTLELEVKQGFNKPVSNSHEAATNLVEGEVTNQWAE